MRKFSRSYCMVTRDPGAILARICQTTSCRKKAREIFYKIRFYEEIFAKNFSRAAGEAKVIRRISYAV